MTTRPEIRIFYAPLLDRESSVIAEKWGWELESWEACTKKAELYRKEWKKHEHSLVEYITDTLGLEFYKPVIDVHLGQYLMPRSEPLIISFLDDPDQFIDTLTHELVHVLLTDNNICQLSCRNIDLRLADRWEALFGSDHNFSVLVHIPVHAVMQKVFKEFFKDESRKEREIKTLKHFNSSDYLDAWSYVEKVGYQKIIDMLKDDYRSIRNGLEGAK